MQWELRCKPLMAVVASLTLSSGLNRISLHVHFHTSSFFKKAGGRTGSGSDPGSLVGCIPDIFVVSGPGMVRWVKIQSLISFHMYSIYWFSILLTYSLFC